MFLICGEALMDMIAMPAQAGSKKGYIPHPGGSPFNVAMALGRQDAEVRFLSRFSDDFFGQDLRKHLEDSGVNLHLCPLVKDLTTLGFVEFQSHATKPEYAFYTRGTAGCGLEIGDLPDPLPSDIQCIHFGSFSLAVEPFGTTLEHIHERYKKEKLISIDPNIRPFLIPDRDSFIPRLDRFLAGADIIKLSDEDLDWLDPTMEAETFALERLEKGALLVVVTRGDRGSEAWTVNGHAYVAAPKVKVVDTVGAGDTFHANLLHYLSVQFELRREDIANMNDTALKDCLGHAARAAALNCTRQGCDPPWKRELWTV